MAESTSRTPDELLLTPAPHLGVRMTTSRMTWFVGMSLLPAAAWGILLFGMPAALTLAVSIGAAVLAEIAATLPFGRFTLRDGSAILTGGIIGLVMPAGVPAFVPAAAAAFGILVVKQSFGGLGRNWMNPAMAGVVFSLVSWPAAMSQWMNPRGGAAQAAAVPPLEAFRAAVASGGGAAGSPLALLSRAGYSFSDLDGRVLGWVNVHLLAPLGTGMPPGSFDVLVGHVAGGIGAVSAPLLLLGAWFLLSRKIIRWHLPVFYLGSFTVLTAVFGGIGSGQGLFAGGPGFQLLSGNLVFAAFFAAPDPVTSPITIKGKCIFGAGLGVVTFFLRCFGSLGDGVAAAIVLGNCASPLVDWWCFHGRPDAESGETA